VTPDWIALDWGTTRLRAWAMSAGGEVLDQAASDAGMGTLGRDGYEPALLALIGGWLGDAPVDVVACGMAGAREGWAEAGYDAVPCRPAAGSPVRPETRDPRLRVHILPGLSQADPPDVMRGEEVQIAGYLAQNPRFDGVICLPGTHTKWAHVSAGEVVSFATAMTGDLFAALAGHTVLRHSLAGEGWSDAAFDEALGDGLARPERLAMRLFSIRAAGLLGAPDPGAARATASGLLIGAELAATKPYWLGQALAVVGADTLARLYARALNAQGATVHVARADELTRAGLFAAWQTLKGTP